MDGLKGFSFIKEVISFLPPPSLILFQNIRSAEGNLKRKLTFHSKVHVFWTLCHVKSNFMMYIKDFMGTTPWRIIFSLFLVIKTIYLCSLRQHIY